MFWRAYARRNIHAVPAQPDGRPQQIDLHHQALTADMEIAKTLPRKPAGRSRDMIGIVETHEGAIGGRV